VTPDPSSSVYDLQVKFALGVLVGLLLPPIVFSIVALAGWFDMSATRPPGLIEELVGSTLSDRSVARRAPKTRNPLPDTPELLQAGLEHYRRDCIVCHGAPGVPQGEIGRGLNPPAPDLWSPDSQEASDGELYFVVAHGLRMTGMPGWLPSHSEREIWEMVAFVRHLPKLTAEERAALAR